jgi:hypothetical protein
MRWTIRWIHLASGIGSWFCSCFLLLLGGRGKISELMRNFAKGIIDFRDGDPPPAPG